MFDETGPQSETRHESVLRRAGQSVLTDDEFEKKTKIETEGALSDLEQMQRRIREQQARCWGQYHATAEEIRAQQEKDAISELVAKELDRFKDEQKRKEEAEEERLRHLYRGIHGGPPDQPKPVESHYSGYPPQRYAVEPAVEQPTFSYLEHPSYPIISSAVNLTTHQHEKNSQRRSLFSEGPLPMDSSRQWKGQQRLLAPEPSVQEMRNPSSRNRSSHEGPRSRPHKGRDGEVDEIERLLKLNQNRLSRLDCLR